MNSDQKPPNDSIKVVAVGYQSVGKTTCWTAAIVASRAEFLMYKNKSLFVAPLNGSYFNNEYRGNHSRLEIFVNGEPLGKTEAHEFEEIKLHLSYNGENFYCDTIDYAGELTELRGEKGSSILSPNEEKLQEEVSNAHCLYVFLDATQSPIAIEQGWGESDSPIAQGGAIQRILITFEQRHIEGWPIVIVITKADVIPEFLNLEDKKKATEKIEEVNADSKKARDLFSTLFPAFASHLFPPRNRKKYPVRICFVAPLGIRPKKLNDGFAIANFKEWRPIGLADFLIAGMLAASEMKAKENSSKKLDHLVRFFYRSVSGAITGIFLILITIGWQQIDKIAAENVFALYDNYQQNKVSAEVVLKAVQETHSPIHWSLYYAGYPTAFGIVIPISEDINRLREIQFQLTIKHLRKELNALMAISESLGHKNGELSYQINILEFLDQHDKDWQKLLSRLDQAKRELETHSIKLRDLDVLEENILQNQYKYLAWYKKPFLNTNDVLDKKSILEVDDVLEKKIIARLAANFTRLDQRIIEEGVNRQRFSSCNVLENKVMKVDTRDNESDYLRKHFNSLIQLCSSCSKSDTRYAAYCKILEADADQWDYKDAKRLFNSWKKYQSGDNSLDQFAKDIDEYSVMANRRKAIPGMAEARYQNQVSTFRNWRSRLDTSYSLGQAHVQIGNNPDFLLLTRYDQLIKGKGYETDRYVSNEKFEEPFGTLAISIDNRIVFKGRYNGKSSEVDLVDHRVSWKPGQIITITVSNESNGNVEQTLRATSNFALWELAGTGLSNNTVAVKFPNMRLPSLPFSDLTTPTSPRGEN